MYQLTYQIKGCSAEIVLPSAPYGVCKSKKSILSKTTHKLGIFKIKKL